VTGAAPNRGMGAVARLGGRGAPPEVLSTGSALRGADLGHTHADLGHRGWNTESKAFNGLVDLSTWTLVPQQLLRIFNYLANYRADQCPS
jgi:hypothetical protein